MTTSSAAVPSPHSPIERLLDTMAAKTRRRIRRDRRNGLDAHEETLTQNLVSELTEGLKAQGLAVTVQEIPRYAEAHTFGADIALWLQNSDGRLAGIHLQAKRQYPNDTYRDLDHTNSDGLQYDLLISGAASSGALAGYAFYNGLNKGQPKSTSCGSNILNEKQHGINVARAKTLEAGGHINHVVRRIDVEGLCAPLSCLVRCGLQRNRGAGPADALASWGPFESDYAGLIAPSDAPTYLQTLIASPSRNTNPYLDDVGDEDIARQFIDDQDEGGNFFTVILASQARLA